IGRFAIPEMLQRGYDRALASGSIAVGGTLGILIPPSIALAVYGTVTEVTSGRLFIAGILSGLLLSAMLCGFVVLRVKRNPRLAPPLSDAVTWAERFESLRGVWAVVVLAVAIIGSIYTGMATPTEAAAIGATGALV